MYSLNSHSAMHDVLKWQRVATVLQICGLKKSDCGFKYFYNTWPHPCKWWPLRMVGQEGGILSHDEKKSLKRTYCNRHLLPLLSRKRFNLRGMKCWDDWMSEHCQSFDFLISVPHTSTWFTHNMYNTETVLRYVHYVYSRYSNTYRTAQQQQTISLGQNPLCCL